MNEVLHEISQSASVMSQHTEDDIDPLSMQPHWIRMALETLYIDGNDTIVYCLFPQLAEQQTHALSEEDTEVQTEMRILDLAPMESSLWAVMRIKAMQEAIDYLTDTLDQPGLSSDYVIKQRQISYLTSRMKELLTQVPETKHTA